jgi:peptidyl-prolyl cis-trans isomerase SurA
MAAIFLLCLPVLAGAEMIDRVVAVVNNDVITLYELNQEGKELFKRIRSEAPEAQEQEALRRARQELLSALIDKKLIEQRAAELGISVSDKELDAAIDRILANNHVSREKFQRDLKLSGTSEEEYRDRLRTQILQSKLIGFEVRSRVVVTDAEIKKYYDQHFAEQGGGDGYHLLQMGFSWNEKGGSPTRSEAKERAEQIRSRVSEGQIFQELANAYSDLPSSVDGGDIGVFKKEEMAPYMREVVSDLQPGQVSPVVETQSGFQFFKLLSFKDGDMIQQATFESVKAELKEKVYQEEAEQQFQKWLEELRNQAYIKKLL